MPYKYLVVFHLVGNFKEIKELQNFMDEFRLFLESNKIDSYEHKTFQEDENINTETWFKNTCSNLQQLRTCIDTVRKFLKEKNINKYDYHTTAEYVKAGL